MTATPPRRARLTRFSSRLPNVWLAFRAIVRSSFTAAKRTNGKDPGGKERRNAPVAKRDCRRIRKRGTNRLPHILSMLPRCCLPRSESRKRRNAQIGRQNDVSLEYRKRDREEGKRKREETSERRNTCRAFDGRDLTEIASPIGRKEELIASWTSSVVHRIRHVGVTPEWRFVNVTRKRRTLT